MDLRVSFRLNVSSPPALANTEERRRLKHEEIESNQYFRWGRWKRQNDAWGQIVEVRTDALGQVILVAQLQRREAEGDWTPEVGWNLAEGTNQANGTVRACH